MHFSLFFVGVLFCNAIPHVTSALRGKPFPTPFAKPRGIGESTPLVNLIWGFSNFVLGLFLLSRHPVALQFGPNLSVLLIGGLVMGIYLSHHFGKVQRNKHSN
jgi:hypothetical protein